jgi:quinol monooxygenase YgiN
MGSVAEPDNDPPKPVISSAGAVNDPESTGIGDPHEPPDVDLTIVTMIFDAADPVVLARMDDGCRNIDLCASVTAPGRYVVIEKWVSPAAQRAHFDSEAMVEMARCCAGLLSGPPSIDLLEGISAHDLR